MSEGRELSGGCLCGAVRYRVTGPALDTYHCHCSQCRRAQGALFGTYSIWPEARFSLESDEAALDTFESSPGVRRRFCRTCGCQILAWVESEPGQVTVSTATLDGGADPGNLEGTLRHIFVGSKVSWYPIADDLPQRQEYE